MEQISGGFFNATMVDGSPDRVYMASHVNDFLEGLVSRSGIYATISSACQVVAGSGMSIVVKTGRGMVGGHWFEIERDTTLPIAESDVVLGRIDRVVVRLDMSGRVLELDVKQGELASNPEAPLLTRNEEVYEICLAEVTINKNASSIKASNITDTRSNTEVCGWIVGLINEFDTTELFNQYEDAQNTFINEKTVEFNEWFEKAKTNEETFSEEKEAEFDEWFNSVQDTVRATSLYREYSYIYTAPTDGVQVISIPESLNYVNDGMDIMTVYVNGWKLPADSFTVSSTEVTLNTPLDLAGTEVELVNKKCVEGTVAESTVLRVEALENKVENLNTYSEYITNETNDNVVISEMVQNFLNATGEYGGISETARLTIKVNGKVGISSLFDGQMVFDLHSSNAGKRTVTLDFGNATLPIYTTSGATFAYFGMNEDVEVRNATVDIRGVEETANCYAFHGGIVKDSKVFMTSAGSGTYRGMYVCQEVSNCTVEMSGNANDICIDYCENVLFNRVSSDNTAIRATTGGLLVGNRVLSGSKSVSGATELGTIS